MKNTLLTFLSLVCFVSAFAQTNGSIAGTVIDKSSQQPIAEIAITLQPSGKGTNTDKQGRFKITGLKPGSYTVTAKGLNYNLATLYNIIINAGNEYNTSIELEKEITNLAGVVVKATGKKTAKAATLETP